MRVWRAVEYFDPKRAYAAYTAKISAVVQLGSIASQIAVTICQIRRVLAFLHQSTNDKDDKIQEITGLIQKLVTLLLLPLSALPREKPRT